MIKPCPWCGSTSVSVVEGSTFRWRVAECDGCGAQCGEVRIKTYGDGTKEEWEEKSRIAALEEWNNRNEDGND